MKADLVNVGMRFGRWLVEASPQIDGKHWKAGCLCDCGRRAQVRVYRLLVGKSKSCGCLVKDIYTKHGMTRRGSHAPEYAVWNAVIARTTRPNTRNFADYGGRGIGVCESWMTFANFIADIGQRPTPKHTLERIDNSKGYSPENCRWATRLEQGNNKRNNRPITAAGKTQNLTQWARDLGCCTATILGRIKLGWPEDRAVLTPPRKMHRRK